MTRDCRPLGSGKGGSGYPNLNRYPLPLLLSCPLSPTSGTHDRSQKTAGQFTKCSASHACTVGTRL
ncbi:unnamed protein product [Staurois parvus]|uniref:Uncharacterized protein n=1 Tax=Staurois parvus TaxID=386267 RepID=A0ABN9C800_9NEOB|nr:unnamed protein product [Staurois parvus]